MGLSEEEVSAFEDYFFHITAAKGSGEHALSHLLGPFAWARHPLEGRLHQLKVRPSFLNPLHPMQVYFIYLLIISIILIIFIVNSCCGWIAPLYLPHGSEALLKQETRPVLFLGRL